jgi:HK97 family phage prohead protease
MQYQRDFSLKVKALDEQTGTFTGYASTYHGVDLVGDTILPGSFKRSVDNQGDGYPLLWAHQPSEPLGLAKVSDSAAGLVVSGSMVMADPAAQRAYAHLKAGSIKGLSIGFTLPPESSGKTTFNADGTRTIRELKLWEISLVAIPANPLAQVTSVKSLAQVESLLRGVKPGDVDAVLMEQLRGIDSALKGLLRKDALCACECPECVDGDCGDCSDPDCSDTHCEGTKAAQTSEALTMMKSFAAELKGIVSER